MNVLLLYNTFRVLGPAFEGPSTARDNESFGTNKHLNRYSPSPSTEKQRPFDDKTDQYHYPTPSFQSYTSSQPSIKPLLPVHQERASTQSFYSYPSSPSIGRSITPVADLNRTLASPEPSLQRSSISTSTLSDHLRQGSTDSFGLPAPPRRTRSPVVHYPTPQPSLERILPQVRMVGGQWTSTDPKISRQASNQTFGRPNSGSARNSTNSAASVELGSSGWHSRNGSNGGYKKPIGSAVNPTFSISSPASSFSSPRAPPSPPRHSRSLSAVPIISPAPAGRQRAVLVSRGGGSFGGATGGHIRTPSNQGYYP